MDDDDDCTPSTPAVRRMRRADYVVLGCFILDEVVSALHTCTVKAYNLAAMHANYVHEQATFREEAAIEIETLTGERDG